LPLHVFAVLSLVVAAALAWTPAAEAQSTSVEELERRLQKAKEEKARRDAAASKAREEAEADRRRRETEATRAAAERKAQEARQANLVVQTDAPCTLFVNGKETAQLAKGIMEVKVPPGQKLVTCASSEEKASFDGELEARSGQDTVLRIPLANKVAEIRSGRAALQEREAQIRKEADARARAEAELRVACERGGRSMLIPTGSNGVLRQCGDSGLDWTRSDNGGNANWPEAKAYCSGLGHGWRLPTVDELLSLHDEGLPPISCGLVTCKVSSQFRLRSSWFWTSVAEGSASAWAVGPAVVVNKAPVPIDLRVAPGGALCVRSH
jgi:hypothetical protein